MGTHGVHSGSLVKELDYNGDQVSQEEYICVSVASRLKWLVAAYADVAGSVGNLTLTTLSLKPLLYEVGDIAYAACCACSSEF